MDLRRLLAGSLSLMLLSVTVRAQCPDQATAPKGYIFEDSAGATGEQRTVGMDQLVVIKSIGREIRQRFTNGGQILLESSVQMETLRLGQVNTFEIVPEKLDAVGQAAEYRYLSHFGGRIETTALFVERRRVEATQTLSIGGCTYETLLIVTESDRSGDMSLKTTTVAHWSPVLERFVKTEATSDVAPVGRPVVNHWMLKSVRH
jgi:hypothetical protein